jgi:3-oxoacyl-[acyl-carrier protein] reductase
MNKPLTDKVAIVTGASRGIGRAIALALAREGCHLALAARTKRDLEETARMAKDLGVQVLSVPTDLKEEDSILALAESVSGRFRRLDILINNAGITHAALMENTRTEDFDRCIAVNARGPFILCRECLPLLKKARPGYIVNISSVVGVKGYPNQTAYTASKHALRGMSMALAEELRNENIRVHVICPGGVNTDMIGNVRPDIRKDELIAPEEIAELVLYLVTHKGNAVVDELHIRRASASPWF